MKTICSIQSWFHPYLQLLVLHEQAVVLFGQAFTLLLHGLRLKLGLLQSCGQREKGMELMACTSTVIHSGHDAL